MQPERRDFRTEPLLDWEREVGIAHEERIPAGLSGLYKLNRNSPANHGRGPLEARQRYVVLCI
jgi:hypothetical protein